MSKIVSSIGYDNNSLISLISNNKKLDYILEFSSAGFVHDENNWKLFEKYNGEKIIHNYFPGYAREPFVLNLASQDKNTLERSLSHCKKCIEQTAKYGSLKFFGVHAGFYFEIRPEHLGNKIPPIDTNLIQNYEDTFYSSIRILLEHSKYYNVLLLIENNVLTPMNYRNDIIPFLCVDSEGILSFFKKFESENNLGLLLDTAHLKVSATTLNKRIIKEFKKIEHLVKGLHHSDNDGSIDNNQIINQNYWFIELMNPKLKSLPNTLEMKGLHNQDVQQIFNLLGI